MARELWFLSILPKQPFFSRDAPRLPRPPQPRDLHRHPVPVTWRLIRTFVLIFPSHAVPVYPSGPPPYSSSSRSRHHSIPDLVEMAAGQRTTLRSPASSLADHQPHLPLLQALATIIPSTDPGGGRTYDLSCPFPSFSLTQYRQVPPRLHRSSASPCFFPDQHFAQDRRMVRAATTRTHFFALALFSLASNSRFASTLACCCARFSDAVIRGTMSSNGFSMIRIPRILGGRLGRSSSSTSSSPMLRTSDRVSRL